MKTLALVSISLLASGVAILEKAVPALKHITMLVAEGPGLPASLCNLKSLEDFWGLFFFFFFPENVVK